MKIILAAVYLMLCQIIMANELDNIYDKTKMLWESVLSNFSKKQKYEYLLHKALCKIPIQRYNLIMLDIPANKREKLKDSAIKDTAFYIWLEAHKKLAKTCYKSIDIKIIDDKKHNGELFLTASVIIKNYKFLINIVRALGIIKQLTKEDIEELKPFAFTPLPIRAKIKYVLDQPVIEVVCANKSIIYPQDKEVFQFERKCPFKPLISKEEFNRRAGGIVSSKLLK